MSVEQEVKDRLQSYHDDWMKMNFANGENFEEIWEEYFADGCLIVRPSGNPLTKEAWKALIMSDDVAYNKNPEDHKLVSIDSCKVFADGKAAVITFTMDIYFLYKGTQNADRAKVSLTWTKDSGSWKIIHFHRATGQEIPKEE